MACMAHSLMFGLIGMSLFTYFFYFSSSNFLFKNSRKITNTEKIMSPLLLHNSSESQPDMVISMLFSSSQNNTESPEINNHIILSNSATVDEINGKLTHEMYESGYSYSNADRCPDFGSGLKLLIMITSAPSHKDARTAIRQTWGSYTAQRADVSIAFFLGLSNDSEIHKNLDDETSTYNDLIIAPFIDTYNNLTLKTVSILEWVDLYCTRVKFVLKTDDDMFINVPALLNFLDNHTKDQQTIFGHLAKHRKPIRDKKSKYFLSSEEYPTSEFPDFTSGPAYLLTNDVIFKLYKTALQRTFLKLEDVFITGIVAEELGIQRIDVKEFFNERVRFTPCNILNGISIHNVKYHEQFNLWKKLFDKNFKCKK